MPVNPYSTPIKLEYKPLGLEAFAKPLSAIREKFETAQDKVDQTEFELSRLAKDDERAKAMLEEVLSARDELAQNLATTGNYRQATQKLLKMNKQFNKGDETVAIKSNYDNYQKALEEQKERLKTGKIDQKDFEMWKYNTTAGFQGTNFDTKTGEYNPINTAPLSDNLQKEIEEKALELAKMTVADRVQEFKNLGMSDAYTEQTAKITIEDKPIERLQQEILGYLKSSDRYKNYINERADTEFKYNNYKTPGFGQAYIESLVQGNDKMINALNDKLKNPNLSPEDKSLYQNQLVNYQKANEGIVKGSAEAIKNDTFNEYAKNLFRADKQGMLDKLAVNAANLVDYRTVNTDITKTEDTAGKTAGTAAKKKLNEIGTITLVVPEATGIDQKTISSGQSTASVTELNNATNIIEMRQQVTPEKVLNILATDPLWVTNGGNVYGELNKESFNKSTNTYRDITVLNMRDNTFKTNLEDTDAQIKSKKDLLKTLSPGSDEYQGVKSEIDGLYLDKKEIEYARSDNFKTLQNVIDLNMNAGEVPKGLKDLYEANKDNPIAFITALQPHVKDHIEQVHTPARTGEVISGDMDKDRPKDVYTKFAEKVLGDFMFTIKTTGFVASGAEVEVNTQSNALTDGALTQATNYITQNITGKSDIKQVKYDGSTGKTEEIKDADPVNFKIYSKAPVLVGANEHDGTIFRYSRANVNNEQIRQDIVRTRGIKNEDYPELLDKDKKEWERKNPINRYVVAEGRSNVIKANAEKNYTNIVSTAVRENDSNMLSQIVKNYAPIHLIMNQQRAKNYYEMAARLKTAAERNSKATELFQAPAAYKHSLHSNGDGTYSGFVINYSISDGNIIATVKKQIMDSNNNITYDERFTQQHNLLSEYNNLPVALVAMDLMYGTGDENDLVKQGNNDIVPALMYK